MITDNPLVHLFLFVSIGLQAFAPFLFTCNYVPFDVFKHAPVRTGTPASYAVCQSVRPAATSTDYSFYLPISHRGSCVAQGEDTFLPMPGEKARSERRPVRLLPRRARATPGQLWPSGW